MLTWPVKKFFALMTLEEAVKQMLKMTKLNFPLKAYQERKTTKLEGKLFHACVHSVRSLAETKEEESFFQKNAFP